MEKINNEFNNLITLIKESIDPENYKEIAIRKFHDTFICGEVIGEDIENPFELQVLDRDNLCQNLYDSLTTEFRDQLESMHFRSFNGSYEYTIILGDSIEIHFPNDHEYQSWIRNQIQKDNEKTNEKRKGK